MSLTRIAHLSDPHFGTIKPGVEDSLLASLRELQPHLILMTGDITQRARRSEFAKAKDFLQKVAPTPVIAVPGNHDIPFWNVLGRVCYPYFGFNKLFRDPSKGKTEKDLIINGVQIIGLNSTSRWRHIQGDFKIARIKERFNEAKTWAEINTTPAIVKIAAFHHPMDCAKHVDEKNLLCGRHEAMEVFEDHAVDLIVGGHIHDPFVNLSPSRYPAISRSIILSVAGTCLSRRTRKGAPNSYNSIDIKTSSEKPVMTITRHDLRPSGQFSVQEVHNFQRTSPGGWVRV